MMKKQIIKTILIISVLVSFSYTSNAISQKDSLGKYLEIAIQSNPGVLQKYYEYEASLQKIFQAGQLSDPELNAGIFLKPMELTEGKQIADFKLMQMFPWFGVIKYGKDEMSLMAKAKYEQFLDAKLQVSYDVLRTWNELFKIQRKIEISKKSIELLQTIERLSVVKYKSSPPGKVVLSQSGNSMSDENSSSSGNRSMQAMGANSGSKQETTGKSAGLQMGEGSMNSQAGLFGLSDLYRIQIEIKELENSIELFKNMHKTIAARFNTFLNRPVSSEINVTDTLVLFSAIIQADSDLTNLVKKNPMLNMIEYEKQSYEARMKMSKSMSMPMVGIGLNYSLINKSEMSDSPMNGKNMIMPMISVTIPIYRKKYNALQKEAQLLSLAAAQNFEAVSNSLQADYIEALQLQKDALLRIDLYGGQKQLAKKSLDIMIRNFSSAGSSLTDILRIRQQLLEYEYKSTEAYADFNTAVALINRITATNN